MITMIVVCMACLFAKSFLSIHTYPEYKGAGTTLMFKINPFAANFVREDRFEANRISPLRICHDEMIVIGQNTLEHIFKIPLLVYLFIVLFLINIYRKIKNQR